MENNVKFCSSCGQQLPADATFCTQCGTAQPKADPAPAEFANEAPAAAPVNEAPAESPVSAPAAKKLPIPTKAITPLIVAALALVMLITAFLPIFTIKSDSPLKETEFNISAVNSAAFMFDSFKSLEYDDIMDSAIAEKYEDVSESYYEEIEDLDEDDYKKFKDLPGKVRRLYNQRMIISYRMALQLEDSKTSFAIVVAGLSAIAYIASAIALFAFAALKLLAALKPEEDENKKDIPQKKINKLFFVVPMLLTLSYFTLGLAMNIPSKTYAPAGGAVFTFVIVALALIASVVCEFLVDKEKFIAALKANMNKAIGVGASVVLAVALLVSLSSPVLTATVKAKFGDRDSKKEAKIDVETSYFADLSLTDEEKENYEEMAEMEDEYKESALETAVGYFERYSIKEIKEGEAVSTNHSFLNKVSAYDDFFKLNDIFSIIPLLYVAAFALALYTLWANLVALVNGEKSGKSYTAVCAAVIVIAIGIALFFSIKVNGALDTYNVKDYSLGLSLGAILAAVFAIGAKVVEVVLAKKEAPAAPVAPEDNTPAV